MSEGPRILVVEDDASIATGLAMNLRYEGFRVEVAHDGDDGSARALSGAFDLLVLDLMLPKRNGYEICRAVRASALDTAVIIVSAKNAEDDKVLGLDLGADDYVTKPFGIREMIARVHAVLRRRGERKKARVVQFTDVCVDLDGRSVTRAGAQVELTAKELRLLESLVARPRRVLSRQELLDAAWGSDYEGSERTVDNFMRRLRVKLEDDPEAPRHLVTVVGLGYRFDP